MLLPQPVPVGGRLCQFVQGWKHNERSLCLKYRFQEVQTSYYETTPSAQDPMGQQNIQEMQDQISLMLQKNAITEVPADTPGFYSNVFLVSKGSGGCHPIFIL